MEKIKAFFDNIVVKTVAWVLLALCSAVLIMGGVKGEDISSAVAMVSGIIAAVATLVAFISSLIKKG